MLSQLADFAVELARLARRETLPRFANGCAVEDKNAGGEFDPVTEADRAAEAAMRAAIEHAHPDHGIAGEEFGTKAPRGAYGWSLDPIDGTRSFICGLPTWVTLVALLRDGLPVAGVIDAPCLDELYVGFEETAWLHARGQCTRVGASACATLAEARLSTTDPFLFRGAAAAAFDTLRISAATVRYGHDGYAYARLAAGTLDLVVESGLKPHDYDALIPVVRGAGGSIGDWTGGADFSHGQVIAAATPELYRAAVAIMGPAA